LSTPRDGNLYIEAFDFSGNRTEVYSDHKVLEKRELLFGNNRIYASDREQKIDVYKNQTPGSDIVWIDEVTSVVLTGSTSDYPHGILGDRIESTGFAVYRDNNLISKYELPKGRVYETLRATVAELILENEGQEIILTSSDHFNGSRVDVYSLSGELLGVSDSIGRGFRWLHVLGVAEFSDTDEKYLAIVKTPHIGGRLELLHWNGQALETVSAFNNVSTHRIGSANLNMAMLLNMDNSAGAEILIPTMDFRTLLVIKYVGGRLKEVDRFELPGVLSTNIFYDKGYHAYLWLGLNNGKIVRIGE
jgi:hypothetical protein